MSQLTTYSKETQIHSLSLLANAAYDLQESSFLNLQSTTTKIVNGTLNDPKSTIQGFIGSWAQVWGPIVFSNNPNAAQVVADNTMMVVYNNNPNQPLFVIGIAGTNAVSTYGWFKEDFGVNTLVDWGTVINKKLPPSLIKPSISAGANNGLQILLGMKDSTGITMLQALNKYITQKNIKNAEVAVAGHSLGGALAPVMAMYMVDTKSTWNNAGNITTISAWPTAGPTPGNDEFTNYFSKNFPGFATNYTSKYNTLDVIPQAWQASTLSTIPNIYSPVGPDGKVIKPYIQFPETTTPYCTTTGTLVATVYLNTIDRSGFIPPHHINYQQINQSSRWIAMQGTFDQGTDNTAAFKADAAAVFEPSGLTQYYPYVKFLYRFIAQLGYQHTKAYNSLLNMVDFATRYDEIKNGIVGKTQEERIEAAFNKALQLHYGLPVIPQSETESAKTE